MCLAFICTNVHDPHVALRAQWLSCYFCYVLNNLHFIPTDGSLASARAHAFMNAFIFFYIVSFHAADFLLGRSEVMQANLRHAVSHVESKKRCSAAVKGQHQHHVKAYREERGIRVRSIPKPWKWREEKDAHPAMYKLLSMADERTRRITRSLRVRDESVRQHTRLALIISCANFEAPAEVIPKLPNAGRDADLLQGSLEELGWEVWRLRDPTWHFCDKKLHDFIREVSGHTYAYIHVFMSVSICVCVYACMYV
jgi:hypothetical protein